MESSHPKKIAISSLINGVLRSFDQPDPLAPACVLREVVYHLSNDHELDVSFGSCIQDVSSIVKEHFKTMKKQTSKAVWNEELQKDHFVEVQHVIRLLAMGTGPFAVMEYAQIPLVQYLHLSYYLNDRRNTWTIPASLNRRKGDVLLGIYTGGSWEAIAKSTDTSLAEADFLTDYLFCFTATEDGGTTFQTPFMSLISLAMDMALHPENDVTRLTVQMGISLWGLITAAYAAWAPSWDMPTISPEGFEAVFEARRQARAAQADDEEDTIAEFAATTNIKTM